MANRTAIGVPHVERDGFEEKVRGSLMHDVEYALSGLVYCMVPARRPWSQVRGRRGGLVVFLLVRLVPGIRCVCGIPTALTVTLFEAIQRPVMCEA